MIPTSEGERINQIPLPQAVDCRRCTKNSEALVGDDLYLHRAVFGSAAKRCTQIHRRRSAEGVNHCLLFRLALGIAETKIIRRSVGELTHADQCEGLRIEALTRKNRERPIVLRARRARKAEEEGGSRAESLIQPNTRGVQPPRQRICLDELSQAGIRGGAQIHSVLYRKSVENRLKGSGCLLPHETVRDELNGCRLRLDESQPFIGYEEKRCVPMYRAAERAAKIVLPQRRLCFPEPMVEPVVDVEAVVSYVIEGAAVKVVRPGARHQRELPAGPAPVFRRIGGGLHTKLLQSIDGDKRLGCAESCSRGDRSARCI